MHLESGKLEFEAKVLNSQYLYLLPHYDSFSWVRLIFMILSFLFATLTNLVW